MKEAGMSLLCIAKVVAPIGGLGILACLSSNDPQQPSTWRAMASGSSYTCGLATTDETYSWGGVGGYYDSPFPPESIIPNSAVPLRVPGGRPFIEISVGGIQMCALDSERAAYCWGPNLVGELGDGSYWAKRGPSAVVGGFRWRIVSAGESSVCGITLDDQTYCWGNQFRGQLGNGELNGSSPQPVAVLGGLPFVMVRSGGGFSCALTAEGDAYCWGVNDYGTLGDGEPPEPFRESATPSKVVGGYHFSSLALGGYDVCGLTDDARALCWGWNGQGELGNGSTAPSSTPVPVNGDHRWASLSLGDLHGCGLTTDGAAYCWGSNNDGEFGIGTTSSASAPVLIASPGAYVAIDAGGRHTCARTPAGTAFCWGRGPWGELGNGTFGNSLKPTQVAAYH